jgi:homoserine/homoserine lactone efflux protein
VQPELYLSFVLATTVLMLIPGPNVALIVGTSLAHGARAGLLTVLGTSVAMVPQLLLTVLGMSSALTILSDWFSWLRWLGVLYLVYLGVQQWRAPAVDLLRSPADAAAPPTLFGRGFVVSLTNPKTLLFYGAFFPQFVDPATDTKGQFVVLGATFLSLAVLIDGTWAVLANSVRRYLAGRQSLHNRISGTLLIGAALGLALARRRS